MGKRIEDLKLDDRPIEEPDPRGTAWYRFVQDIDDLLATGHYTWAEDTLHDIQVTVEKTQRVSEGQRKAVDNIEAARSRDDGYKRRYEGFRGRRWK
jgi:hypothetical protein